jgi:hypothetical protein
MMEQHLKHIVEDMRRGLNKTPYSHHTVDKEDLSAILEYMEEKIEEERVTIHLGDTVQVIEPKEDGRIGVVTRESDYPLVVFELRLPDGEEITVDQENVVKIHG